MKTYSVEIRGYDCHPETCCHEEHFTWWIVESQSCDNSPFNKMSSWVEGFDSREEAEEELNFWKIK
jgi:hypothetical protein